MLDTLLRPAPPTPTPTAVAAPAPAPARAPRAAARRAAAAVASVRFELVVTAHPDALARIVRVASAVPYEILTLHVDAPSRGRRRLRMSVAGDAAGFETLRKRLHRVIDTVSLKVVA